MTTSTKSLGRLRATGFSRFLINVVFVLLLLVVFWVVLNLIVNRQCDSTCFINLLAQSFRYATPIALAAFCGVMCERSGVVDIGIEGKMLMAAMVGYGVNLFLFQSLKIMSYPGEGMTCFSRSL